MPRPLTTTPGLEIEQAELGLVDCSISGQQQLVFDQFRSLKHLEMLK